MKIFTAAQIRACDAYTIKASGIRSADLMERAAVKCMTWIKDQPAKKILPWLLLTALLLIGAPASKADRPATVVDIPTRPQVTQRFVYLAPENPKAAAILFAGGDGGLQIQSDGTFKGGADNFLVRTRQLFAQQGLAVAVIDAPSDRQNGSFLGGGFRESASMLRM